MMLADIQIEPVAETSTRDNEVAFGFRELRPGLGSATPRVPPEPAPSESVAPQASGRIDGERLHKVPGAVLNLCLKLGTWRSRSQRHRDLVTGSSAAGFSVEGRIDVRSRVA